MSKINYDKLKDSINSLQEAIDEYEKNPNEFIQDSCVKRFEVCLDTSWKYMKRYMLEVQGVSKVPNSPIPIFKEAFTCRIIEDPELWIEFNEARVGTSHDYSKDKAKYSFSLVKDFIKEARDLLNLMLENDE